MRQPTAGIILDSAFRGGRGQRHRSLLGYRSFATADASRNIVPRGILIGGEELHSTHHAYSSSARLSNGRWEFDLVWMYIRLLEILRLAAVHRVAPALSFDPGKKRCDIETVHAIITHRFDRLPLTPP